VANAQSRGAPLAQAVVSEDHARQELARANDRRIRYHFIAAPLDSGAPGGRATDGIVTGSASKLKNLPYAITASGNKERMLHSASAGKSFAVLGNSPYTSAEVSVPDDVSEVEIYLGNDAYEVRRVKPLFRVTPNAHGVTHVYIHELPQLRLRRLQSEPATAAGYPAANHAQTVRKPDDTHIGYLTGDVWKDFSYEFTVADVSRLCGASNLTRPYAEDRGRNQVRPARAWPGVPPAVMGEQRPGLPFPAPPANGLAPVPARQGNLEALMILDWAEVLSPIFEGRYEGLIGTGHSDWGCHVDLPVVNIRLRYQQGAFANATGAGDGVTVADVLKRTNPVTYKGVIEAAWKSGIDELVLSSSWRPMLGSILHRMGVGLDVVFVDDFDDRNAQGQPINRFQVNISSGARSQLYSTFEAIIFADRTNLGGFKADPWLNTDDVHRNHLHVSAVDQDAR